MKKRNILLKTPQKTRVDPSKALLHHHLHQKERNN